MPQMPQMPSNIVRGYYRTREISVKCISFYTYLCIFDLKFSITRLVLDTTCVVSKVVLLV